MSQNNNSIGAFIVGVDPVGALPFDTTPTIISQWANSPVLLKLIDDFNQYINPSVAIDDWFDAVWNVQTAVGYGLDVWGRIVGIGRVLQVATPTIFLGFAEATSTYATAFGGGPFYSGVQATYNYPLTDDSYRLLVMAKAAANIWDGSIPGLNIILRLLFPGRICYVTDGENMTMTYTFEFVLSAVELAIVNSGVLPKPCGVSVSIVHL